MLVYNYITLDKSTGLKTFSKISGKNLKWPKDPHLFLAFSILLIMCCIDLDIHVPAMLSSFLFKKMSSSKCLLQKSPWWPCMALETLRCLIIYDSISAVYLRILQQKDLSTHYFLFNRLSCYF